MGRRPKPFTVPVVRPAPGLAFRRRRSRSSAACARTRPDPAAKPEINHDSVTRAHRAKSPLEAPYQLEVAPSKGGRVHDRSQGHIGGWRTYGGDRFETARKVRLWCSEKDDHAGGVGSRVGKERMEFYPDQLRPDIRDAIFARSRGGRPAEP